MAACSTCPSWAGLLVGGDGVMWRGVRTGVSRTHFLLALGPGSGQGVSQGVRGWTAAESGSRLGSWTVRSAVGAGDEGAGGRGAALGEPLVEADHERSSARVRRSGGKGVVLCSACGCAECLCIRQDAGHKVHG